MLCQLRPRMMTIEGIQLLLEVWNQLHLLCTKLMFIKMITQANLNAFFLPARERALQTYTHVLLKYAYIPKAYLADLCF